jgi:hypothetical protein
MEHVIWREKDASDHDLILCHMCVFDRPPALEFHQRKKECQRYAPLPTGSDPAHPAGIASQMKKE